MSFFRKIFGRKPATAVVQTTRIASEPNDQSAQKQFRVFDKYGREMSINADDWRKGVLPASLKSNWNNPEQLAGLINTSLYDGFYADVLAAAEHLYRTDKIPVRGTNIYASALLKNGHPDEAERVLRAYLKKHGDHPFVLTHLAEFFFERKQSAETEETLWRTLELDPNQGNALPWYAAIHRERGGRDAEREAFKRAADLGGSWRPQLWLAKIALGERQLEQAFALYEQSIARAPKPLPADLLMQLSGDLGNQGHLPELLNLVQPHFEPKLHGLGVGNNIVKALVDLGQLEAAQRVLDQLHAVKTPDWQPHLSYWDTEIAKARVAVSATEPSKELTISMLTIDGPVWLKPLSPATELFTAKTSDKIGIAFLVFSAEQATNSKKPERQLADTCGRLTRALPLFLAEQADFKTSARVQTLIPWMTDGAFVLAGAAWEDEAATRFARDTPTKSDYVITGHLGTQHQPWTLSLRLVRTIDSKCVATLDSAISPEKPQDTILSLDLCRVLAEHCDIATVIPSPLYKPPLGNQFPYYLLRLEQLLAVRCAGMDSSKTNFLSGDREIIDGNIRLCIDNPTNVGTRILLANTLLPLKRVRGEIVPEFKEKIDLLQKEYPLPDLAGKVIERMFHEAFSE